MEACSEPGLKVDYTGVCHGGHSWENVWGKYSVVKKKEKSAENRNNVWDENTLEHRNGDLLENRAIVKFNEQLPINASKNPFL